MSRGYGNAERWRQQAQLVGATSARVAAASTGAAATEAIEAVAADLTTLQGEVPGGLAATIIDFEARISALEP